jgi:hypothetical protein
MKTPRIQWAGGRRKSARTLPKLPPPRNAARAAFPAIYAARRRFHRSASRDSRAHCASSILVRPEVRGSPRLPALTAARAALALRLRIRLRHSSGSGAQQVRCRRHFLFAQHRNEPRRSHCAWPISRSRAGAGSASHCSSVNRPGKQRAEERAVMTILAAVCCDGHAAAFSRRDLRPSFAKPLQEKPLVQKRGKRSAERRIQ